MGFWADVAELRRLTEAKVKEGHGSASLQEALREQKAGAATQPKARPKKRSHKKVFLISLVAGVLWSGSRRR